MKVKTLFNTTLLLSFRTKESLLFLEEDGISSFTSNSYVLIEIHKDENFFWFVVDGKKTKSYSTKEQDILDWFNKWWRKKVEIVYESK